MAARAARAAGSSVVAVAVATSASLAFCQALQASMCWTPASRRVCSLGRSMVTTMSRPVAGSTLACQLLVEKSGTMLMVVRVAWYMATAWAFESKRTPSRIMPPSRARTFAAWILANLAAVRSGRGETGGAGGTRQNRQPAPWRRAPGLWTRDRTGGRKKAVLPLEMGGVSRGLPSSRRIDNTK